MSILVCRKIVFILCVCGYFIICPLLILYALGYFVTPGANRSMVGTGLISIATQPAGATVFIENKRFPQKTPVIIRSLNPGKYHLRLSVKDHGSWDESVQVELGKAVLLDKIILVSNQPKIEEVFHHAADDLIALPQTPYMIISAGKTLEECYIYDDAEEKSWPLLRSESPYGELVVVSWYTVDMSPCFIIHALDKRKRDRFIWADIRKDQIDLKDITSLLPGRPEVMTWDPTAPKNVFIVLNGALYRFNAVQGATPHKIAEKIAGFGLFDRTPYYVTQDATIARVDGQSNKITQKKVPVLDQTDLLQQRFFNLKWLSKESLLLASDTGELFTTGMPWVIVEQGLRGIAASMDNKKMLVWTKSKIGVIEAVRRIKGENEIRKIQVTWYYDKGTSIEQAFFANNGSHVVFRDRNKFYLLDIFSHARRDPFPLVTVYKKSSGVYNEENGTLYFLDGQRGTLMRYRLIPQKDIGSFFMQDVKPRL